ncbi:TIGR02453 family protein [marine bacterium AO1-C]|nr:TIGR02453 family protein [marine bacterium AO1-C]
MNTENILNFLTDLAQNNNRDWMHENKKVYQQAKKDFEALTTEIIEEIAAFDPAIEGLTAKDCVFRLNRDIRFSKDKSPYKLNFGASITKGGRRSHWAGYYLQIQPNGESFMAGGSYMPAGENLAKIRQEIDYNADDFRKLLEADDFKKYFKELEGESVKTAPKGYKKDNPNIDLLRRKSFIMWHKITDKQVRAKDYKKLIVNVFQAMKPVNDFLNVAME